MIFSEYTSSLHMMFLAKPDINNGSWDSAGNNFFSYCAKVLFSTKQLKDGGDKTQEIISQILSLLLSDPR